MKIGIDISQLAYENTGVANYLKNLVEKLLEIDRENEYILFYSSLRKKLPSLSFPANSKVVIKRFRIPPTALNILWNKLHVLPIEGLIGNVDVFITSDWTEPPARSAKKATILYDLIVYKYPKETHNRTTFNARKFTFSPNIVKSQKRKLEWVKKESSKILCISNSTKKDATQILGISEDRLDVIFPGI